MFKSRNGRAFLYVIRLLDPAALPSNAQTKPRRRATHPRQIQHQSVRPQFPPASTPPVAATNHWTTLPTGGRFTSAHTAPAKGIDPGRITVHDTGPLIQKGDWRDEPMPCPSAARSSAGDLKRAAAEQAVGGWFDSIRGSHQTHCGIRVFSAEAAVLLALSLIG